MCASTADIDIDKFAAEGPQSTLERKFIQEYLESKGYKLEDLSRLPNGERELLMREACQYASLKLAEVESRAKFRQEINAPK